MIPGPQLKVTRLGDPDSALSKMGQMGDNSDCPGKSAMSPRRKNDSLSSQVHEGEMVCRLGFTVSPLLFKPILRSLTLAPRYS